MSAPVLNRALVLEEMQRLPDGAGGFTTSWTALGTLWASVVAGSGTERAGEFVTLSTVPYRITVRGAAPGAPSRPRPDQRLRDGDRLYRILAVTEADARAAYLTCFAREEVPS
ncbi:head-tail adaptor protein [Frigidibacter albus]|uniref:Head-tail adaptor protein n=1 Tax=Frigidibacter albus TaxID=1465486 RepID=A0A6L8VF40_9RHOB|nr:head-tail adaptor protein [Frigidibacter albus]MZQ88321.1 head-tail adaptor protein [Frigidibacter albus]NBE30005.1 head-tail adaptor protein [Frigidibacter albus]GGH46084.1 tail protein [Frigidibacter albus]